jgi:cell fate regulator YaaT (PSP1 superfamily)
MNDTDKTNEKVNIVGVRFKKAGRVYYYDPADIEFKTNDSVVVNTPRGQKLGIVVIAPEQILASELAEPLKPVIRKGTPEDIKRTEELATKEPEVLAEAAKMVQKLNLQMKLIAAEYNMEGNHLTIFFKAAERVDFRELVKELNSYFKMRVELRQVGPRDEAKLVGGYGRCGRLLCCASFLDEFTPVSIKMAKQQSLPLNPMKIAGSCGRLLCCLAYEAEPGSGKPAKTKEAPVEEEIESLEEIPEEEAYRENVTLKETTEANQKPGENTDEATL